MTRTQLGIAIATSALRHAYTLPGWERLPMLAEPTA